MYSAMDIANYIVKKCNDEGSPVSNLQIQKILYFIQKEYLNEKNELAFSDDIEAWQFGPVVPSVYYRFCAYSAAPIKIHLENIKEITCSIINRIIEQYRQFDPWRLVDLTHQKGGAWDKTFDEGIGNKTVIKIDLIKEEA